MFWRNHMGDSNLGQCFSITICTSHPGVGLRPHPRPTKTECLAVGSNKLHVYQLLQCCLWNPAPDRVGDSSLPSLFLWPLLQPSEDSLVLPRCCRDSQTMSELGQEHLEERKPQVTESTLVLTSREPGSGMGSATVRLDDLTSCHCQGDHAVQCGGWSLAVFSVYQCFPSALTVSLWVNSCICFKSKWHCTHTALLVSWIRNC